MCSESEIQTLGNKIVSNIGAITEQDDENVCSANEEENEDAREENVTVQEALALIPRTTTIILKDHQHGTQKDGVAAISSRRHLDPVAAFRAKHPLHSSCKSSCKLKCATKIDEPRRKAIWEQFSIMSYNQRKSFLFHNVRRRAKSRSTTQGPSKRENTFSYNLTDSSGNVVTVCKVFFLRTLGNNEKNDRMITTLIKTTEPDSTQVAAGCRGKYPRTAPKSEYIRDHVEKFCPCISHCGCKRAPHRRYLPSDITITMMHEDYLTTNKKNKSCSYETYRHTVTNEMNIGFEKLGHEDCDQCTAFDSNPHIHLSSEGNVLADPVSAGLSDNFQDVVKKHQLKRRNLVEDCEIRKNWMHHDSRRESSSMNYQEDSFSAFLDFMNKKLPRQVVLYLRASGFNTRSAFLSFDMSGTETDSLRLVAEFLRTQSTMLKETIPEAKEMYGMYYSSPESFTILPGHRSAINTFIAELMTTNFCKRPKSCDRNGKKSSYLIGKVNNSREPPQQRGSSSSSSYLPVSVEPLNHDHEEETGVVMSLTEMPKILNQLQTTIDKHIRSNYELQGFSIVEGQHYSVHVSPSAKNSSCPITAGVKCLICGLMVGLPTSRSKFRPSNFYRHIKSCIFKKAKMRAGTKKRPTSAALILPSSANAAEDEGSDVNEPREIQSGETGTENVERLVGDHVYGKSAESNENLIHWGESTIEISGHGSQQSNDQEAL